MTAGRERAGVLRVLLQVPARLKAHNIVVTSAGVAFYGLLALVPTLIALVSIYGLVNPGDDAEIKQQIEEAAGSLDDSTKAFVENQLRDVRASRANLTALAVSLVVALFSASGAVYKLINTVTVAYEATETRSVWWVRIQAFLFTLGSVVVVVAMLTVVGVVPVVLDVVDLGGGSETAIRVLELPIFGVLLGGGLTILYRYGPDRSPRTPWRNPGALVATVFWVLTAVVFSVYSSRVGAMPASYGLLGTVAVLMIFLQLTALAVMVGAEYNAIAESHRAEARAAAPPEPQESPRPLPLATAVVGLAALALLGRGGGG